MKKLTRSSAGLTKSSPIRVLQFGGGNFLRAFVDWQFDVLNKETNFDGSIAVVKPTERGDYSELKEQDGLFHVALDGIKNGALISDTTLVSSVSKVIQPYTEWEAYLKLAELPELRFVVSNTTESGIKFSEQDQLTDNPPHEFPAKLTVWLHHRFEFFNGAVDKGCIMLPCELIEENGVALKNTVLQYAQHFDYSKDFIDWIEQANTFCNTLVDRIVSGYPTDRAEEIFNVVGFEDQLLVAGELYHSWVIQADEQVQRELPFDQTQLNVQFVKDTSAYREMKVRVLNGAHTSMVPVAYLAGLRTVKQAMDNEQILQFVNEVLSEEITQTLKGFPESELQAFVNAVLDRFKNPTLKHYLISISLNSTSKFVARLLPALKEYTEEFKELPKRIVFALACLIRFYKGEYEGEIIEVNDDPQVLAFFKNEWNTFQSEEILVKNILSNSKVWGEDLTVIPGLEIQVVADLKNITNRQNLISALIQLTPERIN